MYTFVKEELQQIQGMLRKGYNIDDLTKADKYAVHNMAYLISGVGADTVDNYEDATLLGKMVNEIERNHEEEIKWDLRAEVAHFVISRLDSYDEKEKKGKQGHQNRCAAEIRAALGNVCQRSQGYVQRRSRHHGRL